MTLSMYGQYITERTNREILETEHGFATFQVLPNNIFYIIDIFIKPEYRRSRKASELTDNLENIAKEKGSKWILGSVDDAAKGAEVSHKALQAYGFKPYKSAGSMNFYLKPIEQEILQEVSNG